jgi:hypothetical protein
MREYRRAPAVFLQRSENAWRICDFPRACGEILVRLRFSFSAAKTPGASAIFPEPAGKF